MIRHKEAPQKIDVHFVENDIDTTGPGEPSFPPVFGAVANALFKLRVKIIIISRLCRSSRIRKVVNYLEHYHIKNARILTNIYSRRFVHF